MNINEKTSKTITSIRLPILESDRFRARTLSQQQSNTLAQYNSYLNNACLTTFVDWFKDWIPEDFKYHVENSESLASKWEFVNGTVIQLEDTRIILVPCDELEAETFEIPQEWVDISSWNGDYYLPIEVSLGGEEDECWIEIFGFTTHRQVKANRMYDAYSRTYAIDRKDLIDNLEVLLRTIDLNVKVEVPSLTTLVAAEAKKSIEELGKRSIYCPRLHLPFEKWGALMENETYRKELFDLRMGKPLQETESKPSPISLRDLLDHFADRGQKLMESIWQDPEVLLNQPSVAFRSNSHTEVLSREEIDALTHLLKVTSDEKMRWGASIRLGKIDPTHPLAGAKKARLVDLGLHFKNSKVALSIAMMPHSNRKNWTSIIIEVKSFHQEEMLPSKLKLSILSELNEIKKNVDYQTGFSDITANNSWIVPLSLPVGKIFKVQLSLEKSSFTESFIA